jgi:crossover junction endodeoxyribonuclease RuvC
MPFTILAVDPGAKGAIAFYNPASPKDALVFDLPASARDLHKLIVSRTTGLERAIVERVAGRPGQQGVFNFGFSTGLVHGVLGSLGYDVELIAPAKWKPALGLSTDKNVSRALATQFFPHLTKDFSRVKDDGRAEALLLAVYASARP